MFETKFGAVVVVNYHPESDSSRLSGNSRNWQLTKKSPPTVDSNNKMHISAQNWIPIVLDKDKNYNYSAKCCQPDCICQQHSLMTFPNQKEELPKDPIDFSSTQILSESSPSSIQLAAAMCYRCRYQLMSSVNSASVCAVSLPSVTNTATWSVYDDHCISPLSSSVTSECLSICCTQRLLGSFNSRTEVPSASSLNLSTTKPPTNLISSNQNCSTSVRSKIGSPCTIVSFKQHPLHLFSTSSSSLSLSSSSPISLSHSTSLFSSVRILFCLVTLLSIISSNHRVLSERNKFCKCLSYFFFLFVPPAFFLHFIF